MSKEINIEKKKDHRNEIIAQNNETINGVEKVRPLTPPTLDEDEEETNPSAVLRAYQKDVLENNIKKKLSKSILTPEEEAEIKEKFVHDKTDEIMKNIEDLSKSYTPKENIDPYTKINDYDIINAVSKIFGINFGKNADFYKKAMKSACETVAKANSEKNECVAQEKECAEKPKTFDDICHEMMELHTRKNADYGDAAYKTYKKYGIRSYLARINDKLSRLDELTEPGAKALVTDESILDSFMDMAAYSIMAIEALLKE